MNIYALGYESQINEEYDGSILGPAVLYSPDVAKGSEKCLNVWLQMFGDGKYELNIFQMENSASDSAVLKWSRKGNRGNRWENTVFPLEDYPNYAIKFEAKLKSPGEKYIAIDDVQLVYYDCNIQGACDFNASLCSWSNQDNDDTNWALDNLNKEFIYLDTTNEPDNSTARLISIEMDPTEVRCATFEYMLAGCLTFSISNNEVAPAWKLCESQESWAPGQFPIASPNDFYTLFMDGVVKKSLQSGQNQGTRVRKMSFSEDGCEVQPDRANPATSTTPVTEPPTTTSWNPPTTSVSFDDVGDCNFELMEDYCNWEVFSTSKYRSLT